MALSHGDIDRARSQEIDEARELTLDEEWMSYMQLNCDTRIRELGGIDRTLYRSNGTVLAESSILYWRELKERMVQALARRRAGVPRRYCLELD